MWELTIWTVRERETDQETILDGIHWMQSIHYCFLILDIMDIETKREGIRVDNMHAGLLLRLYCVTTDYRGYPIVATMLSLHLIWMD